MFCIFFFACIYNFCVEKTDGNCRSKCSNLPNDATIIDHLPRYDDIIDGSEEINVYVSDDTEYITNIPDYNTFVLCDNSISLTYSGSISKLRISQDINADGHILSKSLEAPIKFQLEQDLTLIIDKCDSYLFKSITLAATKPNLILNPYFLTNEIINNLQVRISDDSNNINIYDNNDQVKSFFSNSNKLIELSKSYFCISDKAEKCSDYSSYSPQIIDSPSDVTGSSVVLIVESTTNQIYFGNYQQRYIKFIGLEGSHIIYKSYYPDGYYIGNFYVIINANNIVMTNSLYEGIGSFTLDIPNSISLCSTTTQSSIDFTLKTEPLSFRISQVYALSNEAVILTNKKIQVPKLCKFYGPENLKGLFEEGKYVSQDIGIEIDTIENLTPNEIEGIIYYFNNAGTYEIPQTWNKQCSFQGNYDQTIHFIFKNVISASSQINGIISINNCDLTLYPSTFLSLSSYILISKIL